MLSSLAHEGTDAARMNGGSVWMVISMVAFSVFLVLFIWSLLRPAVPDEVDLAAKRFSHGQPDDDFERLLRDIKTPRS